MGIHVSKKAASTRKIVRIPFNKILKYKIPGLLRNMFVCNIVWLLLILM